MNQLKPIFAEFEGSPVTTLTWKGRPAWIARQIAQAMGYEGNGKRLVTEITGDWADEFIPGQDYEMISGDDLAVFKIVNQHGTPMVASKANRGLVLLYESGLHLALTKTNKPVGRRLRRFLVDEVLPHLVRGDDAPAAVPLDALPRPTATELREARLAAHEIWRAGRLDLEDRKFQVATILRTAGLLRELGRLDDDQYVLLQVSACEIALGFPLIHLYPPPVREAVAAALGMPVDEGADERSLAAA